MHASIRLNKKAGHGNLRDHGLAASRIQLGAAYKELAKYARNNQIALSKGRAQLEDAYDDLEEAAKNEMPKIEIYTKGPKDTKKSDEYETVCMIPAK